MYVRLPVVFCCLLAVALGGVAGRHNTVWTADPSRSTVTLSVGRFLLPHVNGTIPIRSATIVTTDGAPSPMVVDARLDATSLTTHDARRDADLRGDRFFDVTRFPTIVFASGHVADAGAGAFRIQGTLTMRGVTHPLELDGRLASLSRDADGSERARYEVRGKFSRSAYGMRSLPGIVSDAVALQVVVEAVGTPDR